MSHVSRIKRQFWLKSNGLILSVFFIAVMLKKPVPSIFLVLCGRFLKTWQN